MHALFAPTTESKDNMAKYTVYRFNNDPSYPSKEAVIEGDLSFVSEYTAIHDGTWWEQNVTTPEIKNTHQYVCSIDGIPYVVTSTLDEGKQWFSDAFKLTLSWYERVRGSVWRDEHSSARIDRVQTIGG